MYVCMYSSSVWSEVVSYDNALLVDWRLTSLVYFLLTKRLSRLLRLFSLSQRCVVSYTADCVQIECL